MQSDRVDDLQAQWARELPNLDTSPMAVLGRIYRLSQLVAPAIVATLGSHNLERGEFDVLAALRRAGAPFRLTPTDLYCELLITSGGLTHRLGLLERHGYVERVPSPTDGRSIEVALTKLGRNVVERAFKADMRREAEILSGLSAAKQQALAKLLREATLAVEQVLQVTAEPSQPD